MPEEFKNLIKGLITVEPPKRWGYEEVQRWLKGGEKVEVHYRTYKPEYEYKEFFSVSLRVSRLSFLTQLTLLS